MIKKLIAALLFACSAWAALNFDKADSDAVYFTGSVKNTFLVTDSFTICGWVQSDSASAQTVINKGKRSNLDSTNFHIRFSGSATKYGVSVRKNVTNRSFHNSLNSATVAGAWHHLAMCWGADIAAASRPYMVLDGVLLTDSAITDIGICIDFAFVEDTLWLGRMPGKSTYFDGKLSDWRLYRKLLTAKQLYSMSQQRGGDFMTDSLKSWYPMNMGSVGTTVITVNGVASGEPVGTAVVTPTYVPDGVGLKTKRRR